MGPPVVNQFGLAIRHCHYHKYPSLWVVTSVEVCVNGLFDGRDWLSFPIPKILLESPGLTL